MANLRILIWMLVVAASLLIAIYAAFQISPWPSALLLRRDMNRAGGTQTRALEKHVSAGVSAQRNLPYATIDSNADLDAFYPSDLENTERTLPTIVWIHGGGWLAGDKDHIANYLTILAAAGYTTIGVNYALAPENTYPTPIRQVNAALAFIQEHAKQLHADPTKMFLAGDSVGAQIAAQVATVITAPAYANSVGVVPSIDRSKLLGVILYCGLYDGLSLKLEQTIRGLLRSPRSLFWSPLRTQLWSYIGTAAFIKDPRFEQLSVARHVTRDFPPMFISVGNADWLASQSYEFAGVVRALGVPVDSLFFPETYTPKIYHEYQFNLDAEPGLIALKRSIDFLAMRLQTPATR